MNLTVAICTWNRADLLTQTLERLADVHLRSNLEWELLVVDNASTDATPQVAEAFKERLPLRLLREERPGLSQARNLALREARGHLLVWTDDDVMVGDDWLNEALKATAAYPQAAVIGGVIEPWFPEEPNQDFLQAFPSLANGFCGLDHGRAAGLLPDPLCVWGANMGFARRLIGGLEFRLDLGPSPTRASGGDETEFQARVRQQGGSVAWWPDMRVRHYVAPERMTLPYLAEFAFGKGLEAVVKTTERRLPLWLRRKHMMASLACSVARLGVHLPFPKQLHSGALPDRGVSSRVRSLVWLREQKFLAGMMAGYRLQAETGAGNHTMPAGRD